VAWSTAVWYIIPQVSRDEDILSLEGIHAIPVTPLHRDLSVDEAELARTVERIVGHSIRVVVACGNTSEYSSLSPAQAERVAAVTIEAAGDACTFVGVGGSLTEATNQARRAVSGGAAGVMIHWPSGPYLSESGLVRYYLTVSAAVDGPVILYVRGQELSPAVLDRVAEIENVVALKYAVPDVVAFAQIAATYAPELVPLCGLAEMWAPFFWLVGARGFTSGLVNVAPDLSIAMLDALRADDYAAAMDVWRIVQPFEQLRAKRAGALNVSVVKEAMTQLGMLEHSLVLPPISELDDEERVELREVLVTWSARV
jgi:4-hydroxy-tetrahydrodipicolinate synthase